MNTSVYILGIVLQAVAAVIALAEVRHAPRRLPWLLIALSSLLIVVRRSATLGQVLSAHRAIDVSEMLTLLISLLFFLGVIFMRQMFRQVSIDQQALTLNEANLREAHEIARMARWELNYLNNRLEWSDEIVSLLEISPGGIPSSYDAFFCFVHPHDAASVDRTFREAVEKRTPFEIEYRLLLKNGRVKWVNGIGRTEYGQTGSSLRSVGTIQDITLRKQADEARHESEERFRSVLENSLDASYRRNLQIDRYDYMSPVIEQITGWTVDEMCTSDLATVLDRIHPDDLARITREIEASLAECRANGKASSTMEYRFRCREGEYRWLADHNIVIADEMMVPAFRLGNVRDITGRKRTEAERERLMSDLQEAVANIKTLSGLIPICASCKKIRDDKGYWNQLETFISEHSDARFSHGICPDCLKKESPELYRKKFGDVQPGHLP